MAGNAKWRQKVTLFVSLLLAGCFGWAYYHQYFVWRGCFNELGRCFDPETGVVYLEQSGAIWLSLTLLFSAVALYQIWRILR